MLDPVRQLAREMTTGDNRRTSIVLLTSAVCLAAWHLVGNYKFWEQHTTDAISLGLDPAIAAGIWALGMCVLLLGVIPLLVVKLVLREKLSDYGIQLGNLSFGAICFVLVAPLVIVIGYESAQSPEFRAMYPINPVALTSATRVGMALGGTNILVRCVGISFPRFFAAWHGKIVRHYHRHLGSDFGQRAGSFWQARRGSVRVDCRGRTVGCVSVAHSVTAERISSALAAGCEFGFLYLPPRVVTASSWAEHDL